jgi:nitroreductase
VRLALLLPHGQDITDTETAAMNTIATPLSALDVIYSRRSVRAYTPDTVPESTVRGLIDAAVQAPTALGAQSWSFVVVQKPHRLARLSSLTKTEFMQQMAKDPGLYLAVKSNTGDDLVTRFSDPGFDVFYGATTLIVICTRGARSFGTADCWLAAENLMLAASALGLGTCCIGAAAGALNSAEMRLELAIPPNVTAVAPIIVGVPSQPGAPIDRREPDIIAWK